MQNGTVKWFNATKGYGFIEPHDKSKDVFLICQQFSGQKITQFFVNLRIPLEINNHY